MKPQTLYTAFDVVPSPKGASTHITYFIRGLMKAGYPLTLISAGSPELPERDTLYGATVLRAPVGHDLNFLRRALAFGDYVMGHVAQAPPYALVHFRSVWSGFPLAQARQRFGYKLLYEVNGLPSVEMKYHYPALHDAPVLAKIKEQELAVLCLADAIICPSQVTRAYIASLGVPDDKIAVIPNGIDPRLFRPVPAPDGRAEEAQARLPTIIYLGTLTDWQGLETLLAAMPLVLAHRAARLRIVGRGRSHQRKLLAKRIRKIGLEGWVTLEPAVPHHLVPQILAGADAGVTPLSYNDRNVTQGCCPLKLLEYMACGVPVVASNLPVVRELARPDVDALLFAPDDPADLARSLLAILDDPVLAGRLAANAAARAHRQFTWQAAQARLLSVYQALLTGSSGSIAQDSGPIPGPG